MWKSNICGSSRACVALPPCRSDSQILFLNEMSFIRFSTQFASFCSSVILFFFLSAIFRPWTVTLWNVAVTQSCQVVLCLTSSRFACLLFMWLCVIVVLRERKRERKKEKERERLPSLFSSYPPAYYFMSSILNLKTSGDQRDRKGPKKNNAAKSF